MTNEENEILSVIKTITNRLSPNGETYTPEELAQAFAEEILRVRLMLRKTTGCLGLLIGGAGREAPAYKETYAAAKALLSNKSAQP